MPRRPKDESEVNLDSLMDALTNVVAVMILVLMLVQIDVVQTVVELTEDLEPATQEMIDEKEAVVVKLREQMKDLQAQQDAEPPTPEEIAEEQKLLALLEKQIEEKQNNLVKITELLKIKEKVQKERDTEKEETDALESRIEELLALLDENPVLPDSPPVEVTIPNSRPIPQNAIKYYAICAKDRVHFIDPYTPEELFYKEFSRYKSKWYLRRIKQDGKDRKVYDQVMLANHFKNFDFKNSRKQAIEIITIPHSNRVNLRIHANMNEGGVPLEDLTEKNNRFYSYCKKLSSNRKNIIFFKVHPDGMNTYLAARKSADNARLPAGWEVSHARNLTFHMSELEVDPIAEPPPRPPPNPNRKPTPPKLDPKLD